MFVGRRLEQICRGNIREVSLYGQLLRDMLDTGNWPLVNGVGVQVVKGGPFTRQDPATKNPSCLHLLIVSYELLPYVQDVFVGSKRKFAVSRALEMRNTYKQVYSDHFKCFLTLKDLPRSRERREEELVVWNLKFKSFGKVRLGRNLEGKKVTKDIVGGINEAKDFYKEEEAKASKEIE